MKGGVWTLRSQRVVTPEGIRAADILIRGEVILDVAPAIVPDRDGVILDVGDHVVLPGLVDGLAHLLEPGRESWEGISAATRAAAAGGVTTLIDAPIHCQPATTSGTELAHKRQLADARAWVDLGFLGGLVEADPGRLESLAEAGALGVLACLGEQGAPGFPPLKSTELRQILPAIQKTGLPLVVLADLAPPSVALAETVDPRNYSLYLASHPPELEVAAVGQAIELARETGCRVHVARLAAAEALPLLASAKREGLAITVDTCPHYLALASEEIPDGAPLFKTIPPIRSASNREKLWEALGSGLIDGVGTDHCPAPGDERHLDSGDLHKAWAGVASLQLALAVVWTEARQRGFSLDAVAAWMANNPAKRLGLGARKGAIAPGLDADLVVFRPDASFVVHSKGLYHRHPASPYDGRTLTGKVDATFLRGTLVFDSDRFHDRPRGLVLDPSAALRPAPPGLDRLNRLGEAEAILLLVRCCGSTLWAWKMTQLRPFASEPELLHAADRVWAELGASDRLEAFAAHERFGDLDLLRSRIGDRPTDVALQESADLALAPDAVLDGLAEANQNYEVKFGHRFVADVQGRSARSMLELINRRLANPPDLEHALVADDQARIMRRKLRELAEGHHRHRS
jgi:allantoinase